MYIIASGHFSITRLYIVQLLSIVEYSKQLRLSFEDFVVAYFDNSVNKVCCGVYPVGLDLIIILHLIDYYRVFHVETMAFKHASKAKVQSDLSWV